MTGLMLELVTNSVILVVRSLLFCKFLFVLGFQVLHSAVATWWTLMKSAIKIPIEMSSSVIGWAYYIASLPIRIMTALQREKMLEKNLHTVEIQLENLMAENKQLGYCLDASFEECRVVEAVLAKMEQEQDEALEKIVFLQNELQDLRENLRESEEHQGKTVWDYPQSQIKGEYGEPPPPEYGGEPVKQAMEAPPLRASLMEEAALERRRYVALYRSTFSVLLSLLVGMIVWEAEDPCMPLVAALFTVVGMSLGSVIQFFSAIQNKPASDAVALLSFNWFVLGTLTSPSLPRLVRALAPVVLRLVRRLLRRIGFSSP